MSRWIAFALATAAVLSCVFALGMSTTASAGGFKQCGDIPSKYLWGIRVQSVGCDKGRKVAQKWRHISIDHRFPDPLNFKQWRCTSSGYGDGENVKCKRGGSDEVRFAFGG